MALCLTFYTAFLIQTPVDGSKLSENISPVYTILHSINRGLNACNTVFHYKLILPQLLNTFSFFYWTVLTTAIRRSLSSGRRIKSTPPHSISFRTISTLPSLQRLCFPHGLSTSEFPTIILYEFFISPLRTTYHTHHTLLDFIGKMSGKEKPTNCKASCCRFLCSFFRLLLLPFTLHIQTKVYKPKYYQHG